MQLSPEELRERGARGRAWMAREFPWEEVGRKMHATYAWLLGNAGQPAFVRTD